jgi:hypothetical protein
MRLIEGELRKEVYNLIIESLDNADGNILTFADREAKIQVSLSLKKDKELYIKAIRYDEYGISCSNGAVWDKAKIDDVLDYIISHNMTIMYSDMTSAYGIPCDRINEIMTGR